MASNCFTCLVGMISNAGSSRSFVESLVHRTWHLTPKLMFRFPITGWTFYSAARSFLTIKDCMCVSLVDIGSKGHAEYNCEQSQDEGD